MLDNLNRLAQTQQEMRPVHNTLDHLLGHTVAAPHAELRTRMLRRLTCMSSLDDARLQWQFVVALDATGHLAFRRLLPPLRGLASRDPYRLLASGPEAKLLWPAGLTLSMASEFIENSDSNTALSGEDRKQDCEVKALSHLLPQLPRDFPRRPLTWVDDRETWEYNPSQTQGQRPNGVVRCRSDFKSGIIDTDAINPDLKNHILRPP